MVGLTYEEFREDVTAEYAQYTDTKEWHRLTFAAATCKILDETIRDSDIPESDKLLTYVVLTLIGLERGELLDEVRAGVLRIIREDRLSKLRDEFTPEDYAAISRDLESVKAKLGA